jgi:hypothetical protein
MRFSLSLKTAFFPRAAVVVSHALLAATPLWISSCSDQPKINCSVTTNPFATKLIEQSRDESVPGACDGFGPDSFNATPILGLAPYYPANAKNQPDYEHGALAVQSTELGTLVQTASEYDVENTATDGKLYSLGDFSIPEPNAENFCPAEKLSPTHVVLAELPAVEDDPATEKVDESFPGQPAVDVKLEWSNVEVYVTAASLGTQLRADLVDTRTTPDGATCKITYKALGLAPAVSCAKLDEDGETPLFNDDGSPQLDAAACDAEANPALGRFTGSGLTTETDYECDPVLAYCVVAGTSVPALK